MKELHREMEKAMKNELKRANEKKPLFRSQHEGGFVILEEVFEARRDADKVDALFADMTRMIFSDMEDAAKWKAKKLKRAALLAACEYIQVAAMAEKFNMEQEGLDQEYVEYLMKTCPEAEEDVEIIAPSFLKNNPDVMKACKELSDVLERVEKENKDAE